MMMQDWVMPGMYGPVHWLMFVAIVALVAYPVGRILRRMGFSPLWAILAFLPLINLLGLWIVALSDWPRAPADN
jgi:hypothetical protein